MAIFKVINSGSAVKTLYLSTISKLAIWKPPYITNTGSTLTWKLSNGYFTTVVKNQPTFDLSTNTGTVNMAIYDVSKLTVFQVRNLSVNYIDVKEAINLTTLELSTNLLTDLDISNNIKLDILSCFTNNLSVLDISTNVLLTYLDTSNNNIAILDVSNNILLNSLKCYNNNQSVNVTNKIFIDLDTNGQINGLLHIRNNADGLGLVARTNLITKGWTIVDSSTT